MGKKIEIATEASFFNDKCEKKEYTQNIGPQREKGNETSMCVW